MCCTICHFSYCTWNNYPWTKWCHRIQGRDSAISLWADIWCSWCHELVFSKRADILLLPRHQAIPSWHRKVFCGKIRTKIYVTHQRFKLWGWRDLQVFNSGFHIDCKFAGSWYVHCTIINVKSKIKKDLTYLYYKALSKDNESHSFT